MTMPRRRDVDSARRVLDYVKSRGCVLTKDVASALGISDDRAYHALQALAVRGELCVVRAGLNIWCIPGAAVDPFVAAVPCLAEVRAVLGEMAEAARGSAVSIVPIQVAKELSRRCRTPQSFPLLVALRSYLAALLGAEQRARRFLVSKAALVDLVRNFPEVHPPCDRLRPAGRSDGLVTVTFKLPRGVLDEVDRLAERLGVRRSDVIRRALEEYLICGAVRLLTQEAEQDDEEFPVIRGR